VEPESPTGSSRTFSISCASTCDESRITLPTFDLGGMTREPVQMLESLIEDKQQRFAFEECEATTIVARADADRVRQIAIT
jgi:hypothetical protein